LLESAAEQFRHLGMSGWLKRTEQLKLRWGADLPSLAGDHFEQS